MRAHPMSEMREIMGIFSRQNKKLIVATPAMGIFDVSDGKLRSEIDADAQSLGQLFASLTISTEAPPTCDVLFIYGHVEPDGRITNSRLGLRDIIRDAKASVVVFASENEGKNYIKAGARKDYGNANLVLTLERKGDLFARFFQKLFLLMKQGTSMPEAWVQLSPQGPPSLVLSDCPSTIFACELGPVRFA
jgi:hypothetical protein